MYSTASTAPAQTSRVPVHRDFFVDKSPVSWGHCEAIIDLTPLNSPCCTGLFINEIWVASDCMLTQRALDGNSHIHEAKHVRESGNIVFVSRFLSGHSMGRTGDTPYAIYPGSIAIRDYSRPFDGIQAVGVAQGIFFQHETLGFDPAKHPSLSVFHAGTAIARSLHSEFDSIFSWLATGARDIDESRLTRIKSCVKTALNGKLAKADVRSIARESLKQAICIDIEQNLTDHQYALKTILTRFGVSRATLFRMFEADGGVRNYISNRRLYRAVLQISKSPMTRGTITQAARKWGFSSDANFNRSVRRVYGASPNSLFEMPIQTISVPKGSRSLWREQRWRLMQSGQDEFSERQFF
ncbi:MAG: AraC family transcriptional regulator [Pseudomonadota bacterium]